MEHIIQFAIGIDDNAIKNRVEATAEKQIIEHIEQQVRDKMFSSRIYGSHADENSPLSGFSEQLINKFLEKHKDEIIDKAAVYLANKLSRTKAGKALLDTEENENE